MMQSSYVRVRLIHVANRHERSGYEDELASAGCNSENRPHYKELPVKLGRHTAWRDV